MACQPRTLGTGTAEAPALIVRVMVEPGASFVPARGCWSKTRPAGISAFAARTVITGKPADSRVRTATASSS